MRNMRTERPVTAAGQVDLLSSSNAKQSEIEVKYVPSPACTQYTVTLWWTSYYTVWLLYITSHSAVSANARGIPRQALGFLSYLRASGDRGTYVRTIYLKVKQSESHVQRPDHDAVTTTLTQKGNSFLYRIIDTRLTGIASTVHRS